MAMAGVFRAQAAMEYLVTYGWALLALFFVVAYLISTGAFSANSFSAQECTFQPDLYCYPYALYKTGADTTIRFSLANGLGFPINVTSVNYTVVGAGPASTLSGTVPSGIVNSGEKMNFSQILPGGTAKDFRTVMVSLEYQNCRTTPCTGPYVTSGRVAAIIEGS